MTAYQFDSLHIQERDIDVLRGLFESRIMTIEHIAAIFFNGKREYTKKRLQMMKAAGFVDERKRLINEQSVLFLTRKAFTILRDAGALSDYPALSVTSFESRANVSALTVQHELAVMDVKAAFHIATRTSGNSSIAEFSTWPRLYEFKEAKPGRTVSETTVRPDGFIRLQFQDEVEHSYFLEVDRSTEAQGRLLAQSERYRKYYYGGGFAIRNGAAKDKFKDFPFRLLMVFKSAERRNNTAESLLHNNPPILSLVWLATLAEVVADPLGAIWIQPRDYRETIKGTVFETESRFSAKGYKRQIARERLVESKIRKWRLFSANSEG